MTNNKYKNMTDKEKQAKKIKKKMKKVITKNPRPIKRNYCWKKQGELKKNKIVISDEFKLDDGVNNFIGYKKGESIKPLFIVLPQMSGFVKYFENNKKKHVIFG